MMPALLAPVILLPVLLALVLVYPAGRPLVVRLLPYAPWPALLVALLLPPQQGYYPAVLLGLELGLDPLGRVFLLFTAVVWSAVGFHLRGSGLRLEDYLHRRFLFCYLLALAGNLGVILVMDAAGFYLFFALLSIAAYGLIVTDREPATLRAGRIYIILALFGEIMILAGFIYLAGDRGGMAMVLLLTLGLGVKHGILPLHMWLPLAHGIAPPPASALLSGVLLKAGVIGWLRFLPEAPEVLPAFSLPAIVGGLAAAFLAALAGILQAKPKMLLAYSSISQMGILTAGFGMAFAHPGLWALMLPVLTLFTLHHALVKAALFLGVGVDRGAAGGGLVLPMLLLLALALAGAPLTGGALVKLWTDQYVGLLPPLSAELLGALLPLTSVTSTVLMLRFLWLVREAPVPGEGVGRGHASPRAFLLLGLFGLVGPWLLLWQLYPAPAELALSGYAIWKTLWPVLLGMLPVLAALRVGWRLRWTLPPGDIVVPLERLGAWLGGAWSRLPTPRPPRWPRPRPPWPLWEARLRRSPVTGVLYLLCLLVFALVGGVLWAP